MRFLKAFGRFWYDFIIGDDWKIAAYVVGALALVAALAVNDVLSDGATVILGAVLTMMLFALGVRRDARRSRPRTLERTRATMSAATNAPWR